MKNTHETREGWLMAAVEGLRPFFAEVLEAPVPEKLQATVSWAKGRSADKAIGQCFAEAWTEDGTTHVAISPVLGKDLVQMLGVLVHELVHAAVGCEEGHKGRFKKVARKAGLEGKLTATFVGNGSELYKRLASLAEALGPYPHSVMANKVGARRPPGGGWVKFVSKNEDTYILRLSPKALAEFGPPLDPWGEVMEEA